MPAFPLRQGWLAISLPRPTKACAELACCWVLCGWGAVSSATDLRSIVEALPRGHVLPPLPAEDTDEERDLAALLWKHCAAFLPLCFKLGDLETARIFCERMLEEKFGNRPLSGAMASAKTLHLYFRLRVLCLIGDVTDDSIVNLRKNLYSQFEGGNRKLMAWGHLELARALSQLGGPLLERYPSLLKLVISDLLFARNNFLRFARRESPALSHCAAAVATELALLFRRASRPELALESAALGLQYLQKLDAIHCPQEDVFGVVHLLSSPTEDENALDAQAATPSSATKESMLLVASLHEELGHLQEAIQLLEEVECHALQKQDKAGEQLFQARFQLSRLFRASGRAQEEQLEKLADLVEMATTSFFRNLDHSHPFDMDTLVDALVRMIRLDSTNARTVAATEKLAKLFRFMNKEVKLSVADRGQIEAVRLLLADTWRHARRVANSQLPGFDVQPVVQYLSLTTLSLLRGEADLQDHDIVRRLRSIHCTYKAAMCRVAHCLVGQREEHRNGRVPRSTAGCISQLMVELRSLLDVLIPARFGAHPLRMRQFPVSFVSSDFDEWAGKVHNELAESTECAADFLEHVRCHQPFLQMERAAAPLQVPAPAPSRKHDPVSDGGGNLPAAAVPTPGPPSPSKGTKASRVDSPASFPNVHVSGDHPPAAVPFTSAAFSATPVNSQENRDSPSSSSTCTGAVISSAGGNATLSLEYLPFCPLELGNIMNNEFKHHRFRQVDLVGTVAKRRGGLVVRRTTLELVYSSPNVHEWTLASCLQRETRCTGREHAELERQSTARLIDLSTALHRLFLDAKILKCDERRGLCSVNWNSPCISLFLDMSRAYAGFDVGERLRSGPKEAIWRSLYNDDDDKEHWIWVTAGTARPSKQNLVHCAKQVCAQFGVQVGQIVKKGGLKLLPSERARISGLFLASVIHRFRLPELIVLEACVVDVFDLVHGMMEEAAELVKLLCPLVVMDSEPIALPTSAALRLPTASRVSYSTRSLLSPFWELSHTSLYRSFSGARFSCKREWIEQCLSRRLVDDLIARREFGQPLAEACLRNANSLVALGLAPLALDRLEEDVQWIVDQQHALRLQARRTELVARNATVSLCPTLFEAEPLLFARLEHIGELFYCAVLPEMAKRRSAELSMDELRLWMADLQSQLGELIVAARALLERTFALSLTCCVLGENPDPMVSVRFPGDPKAYRQFTKSCPVQCVDLLSFVSDNETREVYSQLVAISNCCKHGSVTQPPVDDWADLVRQADYPVDELAFFFVSPKKDKRNSATGKWISGSMLLERSLNLIERLMLVVEHEIYAPRIAVSVPDMDADQQDQPLPAVHPLDRIQVHLRCSHPPTAAEVLAQASNQVGVPVQYLRLASLDTKLEGETVIDESVVRNNYLLLFQVREPGIVCVATRAIAEVCVVLERPWWRNLWAFVTSTKVK